MTRLQLLSETKVNDSERVIIFRVSKDNIERFEVKMNDVLGVDELETSDNLLDEDLTLLLGETVVIMRSPGDQVPTGQVLRDQD